MDTVTNPLLDLILYDPCCGSPPRVVEEAFKTPMRKGFVSIYCDSCGDAIEYRLPAEAPIEWNLRKRAKTEKQGEPK